MTCREKLKELHPDWDDEKCEDIFAEECPDGYMDIKSHKDCGKYPMSNVCEKCWDREIPETKPLANNSNIEKEKNMATTKKTKAELLEELENVKNAKAELEKELKNLEKYKQYEDAAGEVHALYTSFVMAGFTEDQAFELLKVMMQNAGQINFNASIKPSYRYTR